MKALITGGAGFVGSHLCEELLARGSSVTVLDDLSTGSLSNVSHLVKNKRFRFHKGSILDAKLTGRLIKGCAIVYHLAAAVGVKYILDHPLGSILTNIKGTEIVLDLCDRYGAKVLIASSSEVYGKHVCAPFSEDDDRVMGSTSVSRWSYADGKAVDEFLALAYAKERKLRVVIVRLFNTVGPRQSGAYGMVLPRFIGEALHNRPIVVYGDGSQVRSFAHVKDVAGAMARLSLIKKAEGEVFNIGTDQQITVLDLARKVKQLTASKSPIRTISFKTAFGGSADNFEEIECRIPDLRKITKAIGYSPRYDIDAIIRDSVEHQRKRRR